MRLLPKSIHRCHRYPTKFNSGRDIPRRPISGGKQLKKRPNGTGSNRIAGALRMAAVSLSRSKTALGAYYRRIARRKDGKTAVFATARKLAHFVFIAVGTALTGGPPHRSQRALLTHWAPTSGHDAQSLFGVRVQNTNRWKPAVGQTVHALPGHPVSLAPLP